MNFSFLQAIYLSTYLYIHPPIYTLLLFAGSVRRALPAGRRCRARARAARIRTPLQRRGRCERTRRGGSLLLGAVGGPAGCV